MGGRNCLPRLCEDRSPGRQDGVGHGRAGSIRLPA